MKLVTEQIQYLRKRRQELLELIGAYTDYCSTRESAGVEKIGWAHYPDNQYDIRNSNHKTELDTIERTLHDSDFQTERNFEMIDIGTAFYVDFGDGDVERTMIVDANEPIATPLMFVSSDSDFGKAVLGKKEGEEVSYKVAATGRTLHVSIKSIDQIQENYLHFIREKNYSKRICHPVQAELKRLKEEDPVEYRRRQSVSQSQEELLKEELSHLRGKNVRRCNEIIKTLEESPVLPAPVGEQIQVGSHVEIMLMDGETPSTYRFELINKAVSTELEGDYVERITILGNAVYGRKEGDIFYVRRKNLPSIKGKVLQVINQDVKRRVR
ncbi:MAG: GreA/GreB family elongation factor [Bacilli bacterium]|nr:GreA/GreB family elongation factor [Bacilli bacterium]